MINLTGGNNNGITQTSQTKEKREECISQKKKDKKKILIDQGIPMSRVWPLVSRL